MGQWPGPSPQQGCPVVARPGPQSLPLLPAKGLGPLGAAEHNQTGGVGMDGVLLQSRVTARVCGILWLGLHGGSGRPQGVRSGTFASGQATPSSPGAGASQQHGQEWYCRDRASCKAEQPAKPISPLARAPAGRKEAAVV